MHYPCVLTSNVVVGETEKEEEKERGCYLDVRSDFFTQNLFRSGMVTIHGR